MVTEIYENITQSEERKHTNTKSAAKLNIQIFLSSKNAIQKSCGKEARPCSRPSIVTSSSIKSYPHPPARSCCRSRPRRLGSQSSTAGLSVLQTPGFLDRRRHRCCLWLDLVLD